MENEIEAKYFHEFLANTRDKRTFEDSESNAVLVPFSVKGIFNQGFKCTKGLLSNNLIDWELFLRRFKSQKPKYDLAYIQGLKIELSLLLLDCSTQVQ